MLGVNSENTNSQQQEKKEEPVEWKIKVQNYFFNRVESSSGHTSAEKIQDNNFFIANDEEKKEKELYLQRNPLKSCTSAIAQHKLMSHHHIYQLMRPLCLQKVWSVVTAKLILSFLIIKLLEK